MNAFTVFVNPAWKDEEYMEQDREVLALVEEHAAQAKEQEPKPMERAEPAKKEKPGVLKTLRSLEVFGAAAGASLTLAASIAAEGHYPAAAMAAGIGIVVYVAGGAK